MPHYDYVCDGCEHEFELFQSITANVKRKCPECGRPKLRRLIGPGAALLFKGSGFYKTDYRSESYKKSAKEAKPSKSTADGKKKSKGEKKPAAKPAVTSSASMRTTRSRSTTFRTHSLAG